MARSAEEAFRHTAEVAKAAGLTMLATRWAGANANYSFRCREGHIFERRPSSLTRGSIACEMCARTEMRHRFLGVLAQRGLACEEGDYLGGRVRHHFQCGQGHRWDAEARKVLEGSGCPVCSHALVAAMNTDAAGLERLRHAATVQGGRCLAAAYVGIIARYEWECANGHRWHASGQSVVRGRWCRVCFGRRHSESMLDPDGLVRLQAVAASHGGQCLDREYFSVNEKYRFRCAAGHEWRVAGASVLQGRWCRRCAVKRTGELQRAGNGLAQLEAAAASHGGEVVAPVYAGVSARYTFRCARGHEWQTRGTRILLDGSWCRRCAGLRRRHTIETMQQIAAERGGRCLSTEYVGAKVRLLWECHRGHVWPASPSSVLSRSTWCPNCAILARTKKQRLRRRYDYEGRP